MITKICNHCRNQIDQWATRCPYCTGHVNFQGHQPGTPVPFFGFQVILVLLFALWIIWSAIFA